MHTAVWKNEKFSLKKIFRQINSLFSKYLIPLVKTLLSRIFCQKCSNFHTLMWQVLQNAGTPKNFRERNSVTLFGNALIWRKFFLFIFFFRVFDDDNFYILTVWKTRNSLWKKNSSNQSFYIGNHCFHEIFAKLVWERMSAISTQCSASVSSYL